MGERSTAVLRILLRHGTTIKAILIVTKVRKATFRNVQALLLLLDPSVNAPSPIECSIMQERKQLLKV